MAQRRMLSRTVVGSDGFLELSFEARALYLQLITEADDDGMVENIKRQLRIAGAGASALDELTGAGFTILFASGICAICHWNVHNKVRRDRYRPTLYAEELSALYITDAGVYRMVEKRRQVDAQSAENAPRQAETAKISAPSHTPLAKSEDITAPFSESGVVKKLPTSSSEDCAVKKLPTSSSEDCAVKRLPASPIFDDAEVGDESVDFLSPLVTREVTKEYKYFNVKGGSSVSEDGFFSEYRRAAEGEPSGDSLGYDGLSYGDGLGGDGLCCRGSGCDGLVQDIGYTEAMSDGELEEYSRFITEVRQYFIHQRFHSSPESFITYNEQRGWRGIGGECVRKEFMKYADMWEDRERMKNGAPPIHYYDGY